MSRKGRFEVVLVEGTEAVYQLLRDGEPLHAPLPMCRSQLQQVADALNAEERLGHVEQCPKSRAIDVVVERCQRAEGHDGRCRWPASARAQR